MARMRGPGSNAAFAVALVVTSILFVLSLVLAIVFYSQIAAARLQKDEAVNKLDRLANTTEQQMVTEMVKPQSGETAVGALIGESRWLKKIVSSNPQASRGDLETELKTIGVGADTTLASEVRRLQAEKAAADARVKQAEDDAKVARERLAQIEKEKGDLVANYKATETALQAQLDKINADAKQFDAAAKTSAGTLEARLADQQAKSKKEQDDLRAQMAKLDTDKNDLKKRLDELQGRIGPRGATVDPTKSPDGHIVALLSEENLVYIDLGKSNHLPVGITFEVYDRGGQVDVNPATGKRGKATIEVTKVAENSATARVVRLERGKNIIEGDLIANVVYDPNVTYKFYVFGDFDLDNIGLATSGDRHRVETMITNWGGKVNDALSFETDFLVLGQEPKKPDPLASTETDPKKIADFAARQKNYDTYQALIGEARVLAVPVLNQNRFLALVGFYQR